MATDAPPRPRALSVVRVDQLPAARVLAGSVRSVHPDWSLELVLVAGESEAERLRATVPDGAALLSAERELSIPVEELVSRHESADLLMLLVARLLRDRLRDGPGAIVHLPATAWVVGSLDPLTTGFEERPVLLVPRLGLEPPDDGLEPSARTLHQKGRIVPDLLAIDGSQHALAFLEWWIARCENALGDLRGHRLAGPPEHRHWLQRSLELATAREDVTLLRAPGIGLSAWNLHEHRLDATPSGVRVDGTSEVRLLDLEGYSPDRPWQLRGDLNRTRLRAGSPLAVLTGRYGEHLRAAGWGPDPTWHSRTGRAMPGGLIFDATLWRLSAIALADGIELGDPLSADGARALTAWLLGPAPHGAEHGINRYVYHRVLFERPDVVTVFPQLDGPDGAGLIGWLYSSGREEMEIPEALMPAHRDDSALDAAATLPPARSSPSAFEVTAATAADEGPIAVRVSGYLGHVLGLGAAARGYARALDAAGVATSTATISLDHLQRPVASQRAYGRHAFAEVAGEGGHGFELVCVNPDELPDFVRRVGLGYFQGRRIGVWGWETNAVPASWGESFAFVDEIWTYSRFVAENLAAASGGVPVTALAPPVIPPASDLTPERLGVPEGFLFLFVFDYSSTIQRKNPVGLVRAFTRAFAEGEGPRLLIKTLNGPRLPIAEDELLWAASARSDIHIVDRSLDPRERDALMLACDCYVSLHRSEGFGLTMAEAMSVGKPVIATNYSGNTDFMNAENSFLVDYTLTRVGADVQIYPADGEWAEPDIDHAAALMRQVVSDRDETIARGERARRDIAAQLSPEATGAAMRSRLQALSG